MFLEVKFSIYLNRCLFLMFYIALDKRGGYPHDSFLISPQKIGCGYSLEVPRRVASNGYHNNCIIFCGEIRKKYH